MGAWADAVAEGELRSIEDELRAAPDRELQQPDLDACRQVGECRQLGEILERVSSFDGSADQRQRPAAPPGVGRMRSERGHIRVAAKCCTGVRFGRGMLHVGSGPTGRSVGWPCRVPVFGLRFQIRDTSRDCHSGAGGKAAPKNVATHRLRAAVPLRLGPQTRCDCSSRECDWEGVNGAARATGREGSRPVEASAVRKSLRPLEASAHTGHYALSERSLRTRCRWAVRQLQLSPWRSFRALASTGSPTTTYAMLSRTPLPRSPSPTNPTSPWSSALIKPVGSSRSASWPTTTTTM